MHSHGYSSTYTIDLGAQHILCIHLFKQKKAQRRDSTEPWQSPEVFRSKDFFAPQLKGLEPSSVTPPGAS